MAWGKSDEEYMKNRDMVDKALSKCEMCAQNIVKELHPLGHVPVLKDY